MPAPAPSRRRGTWSDLGHRRFAILSFLRASGPPIYHPPGLPRAPGAAGMPTTRRSSSATREALAAAGIDIDSVPMVQGQPWGPDAARMLLDVAPDATAILSMSVMQGLELLKEARRRGRVVPRDLSVVGYNDLPEAATSDPPLTTVDGMNVEKGRTAARLVLGGGAAAARGAAGAAHPARLDRTAALMFAPAVSPCQSRGAAIVSARFSGRGP